MNAPQPGEQIERIEVQRAPAAAQSTQAMVSNIIPKDAPRRTRSDLR